MASHHALCVPSPDRTLLPGLRRNAGCFGASYRPAPGKLFVPSACALLCGACGLVCGLLSALQADGKAGIQAISGKPLCVCRCAFDGSEFSCEELFFADSRRGYPGKASTGSPLTGLLKHPLHLAIDFLEGGSRLRVFQHGGDGQDVDKLQDAKYNADNAEDESGNGGSGEGTTVF